jgi:hypothetical protein
MPFWRTTVALNCKLPLVDAQDSAVEDAPDAVTVMPKAASEALEVPLLTLISTFAS